MIDRLAQYEERVFHGWDLEVKELDPCRVASSASGGRTVRPKRAKSRPHVGHSFGGLRGISNCHNAEIAPDSLIAIDTTKILGTKSAWYPILWPIQQFSAGQSQFFWILNWNLFQGR